MEQFLKNVNTFNGGIFADNVSGRISTLIVAKEKDEIALMLNKIKIMLEETVVDCDIVCLRNGEPNPMQTDECLSIKYYGDNIETVLADLVQYAKNCKSVVSKKRCKSLVEYNKTLKVFDSRRTIIVIPNLDTLLNNSSNAMLIKNYIIQLVKMEEYSGVGVVACSTLEVDDGLDFCLLNVFNSRVLFNVDDNNLVRDVSLGMYKSTEMLEINEFYYFSNNYRNGILLSM